MMKCIILRPGHSRGSNPRKTVKYPLVGPHYKAASWTTKLSSVVQFRSEPEMKQWEGLYNFIINIYNIYNFFPQKRPNDASYNGRISTSPRWKVCPGVCWGWRQQWRILQSTQLLLGIQSCQVSQLQHNQPPADRDSSKSQPYPHSTIIKH